MEANKILVPMTDEEYENYKKNKELISCGEDLDKFLKYIGFELLDRKFYKNSQDPLNHRETCIETYKNGKCEVTVVTKE